MLVGKAVARREDRRLLTGRGCYADDIHLDGMLHAAVLRSPWPHARITGIRHEDADEVEGVVGIFTHEDMAGELHPIPLRIGGMPGLDNFLQYPLASEKVRFVGEPIAVVVATSRYIAEDALTLIEIEADDLPPVGDWAAAVDAATLLHDEAGANVSTLEVGRGDPDAAFATAPYVRRENFSVHRHTAIPMETRGLVAQWDEARQEMTVWGATKIPFQNRSILASMLGLPDSAVVMKSGDVGGSFGVRGEFYPEDFLVPYLARRIGRPIKWIEDRQEHFLSTNHAREVTGEVEIACDRDGIILGLRATVTTDVGAYLRGTGTVAATRCAQFLPGPYRIDNFACTVNLHVSNKVPCGTYRGPGRVEATFFRERLIDMAAADLGIDAAEMRRRNFLTSGELPYKVGNLVAYDPDAEYDSGEYLQVFDEAMRQIGWQEKQSIQGRKIDGWYHGIGIAPFVESSAGGPREYARLKLEEDGIVELIVGSASSGQGHETVFTQICADELGMGMDDIRTRCASTDELVDSLGTWHSRSSVMAGNAVRITSQSFKRRLEDLAREALGRPNLSVEWSGREIRLDGAPTGLTLTKLAGIAQEQGRKIDVTDVFENDTRKPFSFGTHAAHIAVDAETGRVKVLDFVAIEDIGKVLNPLLAHGQTLGGIVQGLGGTFLENLVYDPEGQLLTASFADYLLPTATDFPNIRGEFMELALAPGNPLGVKGGGEGGIVAVAAAIGNAISAALASYGVQVRHLPLTPPRVWELIRSAREEKAADPSG